MTSTAGVSYTYDGDGRRVKKSNGTLYWYGLSGEVLLETNSAGNNPTEYMFFIGQRMARRDPSGSVFYYFEDHLSSSRVIVEGGQDQPCYDADFYPFGGERVITDICPQPYKFTGQERDSESGLDYLGARHYASNLGRFVQVDPLMRSGNPSQPQSWNRYTYALNNPLRLVDPTGMLPEDTRKKDKDDKGCRATSTSDERDGCQEEREDKEKAKNEGLIVTDPEYLMYRNARFLRWLFFDVFLGVKEVEIPGPWTDTVGPPLPRKLPIPLNLLRAISQRPEKAGKILGGDWEWRGDGPPETGKGAWHNRRTGESLHPDISHPGAQDPHYDYTRRGFDGKLRLYPSGEVERAPR